MENIENDLQVESLNLNGSEEGIRFNATSEILDGDDYYTIEELSESDSQRVFLFYINNNSNKEPTVDEIKKIFNKKYGFYEDALSIEINSKKNVNASTVCKRDDVIFVSLDVMKNRRLMAQDGRIIDSMVYRNTGNKEIKDDVEQKIESPYKDMIEEQTKPIDSDPTKTEIAITIDDGYYPDQIKRMLDVLDRRHIKATFFALGEVIAKNTNIWKDIIDKGHQVCCHTYSHAYIEDAEYTKLFTGHGIPAKNTAGLVKQWEGYVKNILGQDEYDNIKMQSGPGFPQKINTALLLDTEIRMWEIQVKKSLGEDYFNKMKTDFPFFRFPGKVGANRPENIAVLKKHGYLSIGRTHESGKDTHKIGQGGIELLHTNKKIADHFEQYLDDLGITGTQVTDIVTPN